ncbi:MAG: hypothetical protein WC370_01420 [Dehalococcoidales bacterium]|jgi:hypothetical protein
MKTIRLLGIGVAILGIAALAIGVVFVVEGFAKNNLIVDRMNVEKVSIALDPNNPTVYTQINNAAEAQQAADTIASHRRAIAPTYQDLLAGGQFDPTNPKDLTYAQAMNLENYLYMAVTAFGLIQVTEASGAFMIITGLAIGGVGLALYRIGRNSPQQIVQKTVI